MLDSSGPGDLLGPLDESLRSPHPLTLLEHASVMAVATEPDRFADLRARTGGGAKRRAIERTELIDSFLDVGYRETDALLLVWAEMLGHPELRERIRNEVGARRHPLPNWLRNLDQVRPTRVIENSHILGDGENVFIGVETPGRSFTIVLYIDHNVGTIPKDGFTVDRPISEVVGRLERERPADTTLTELLLEDGRAKLSQALEHESRMLEQYETDTWPGVRPLTEWMLRLMPEGGTGYEWTEPTQTEIAELTADFMASPFAPATADASDQASTLFGFASHYGTGDPLRWSAVVAEVVLLDMIPRKILADGEYLRGMPETLRGVIRFAHDRRGIPVGYTQDALDAISHLESEYFTLISAPRRTGPAALLERMGVLGPLEDDELYDGVSDEEYFLRRAALRVGGMDALNALSVEPLPDEELDLSNVAAHAVPRVQQVADITDRVCAEYFNDGELRTATRRILSRIAEADPDIFLRGKVENAASAVCWIAANANDAFHTVTVKDMLASINVKSTPNDRALTMLSAIGVDWYGEWEYDHALGDPNVLTASTRERIIAGRDRLRASLAAEGD